MDLSVKPGTYPSIYWRLDHVAVILMPSGLLQEQMHETLRGALCHEILHALMTDGEAMRGVLWGLFVITNGCEDARIEHQASRIWRGLVRVIRGLTLKLLEFRRRSRKMGSSAETSKLYEIALALYLLLSRLPMELIEATTPQMPLAVAQELMDVAADVLDAPDTAAVVDIARRVIEQLKKAADAAARRIGTSSASTWSKSLKSELKHAMERTVEEVYAQLRRRKYPTHWFGPWRRDQGGFAFYSSEWAPPPEETPELAPLTTAEALDILAETDPLIRHCHNQRKLTAGRLDTQGSGLIRAALAKDKRVFQQTKTEQRLVLLDVLGCADFVLLIEAHDRYMAVEWERLLSFAITLGRLLRAARVSLAIRAWNATRTKETVRDSKTGRTWERWSKNHYINIARLKDMADQWSGALEDRLASLSQNGFNQPLEGYSRASKWKVAGQRGTRQRVFLCLGNARQMNLAAGNLGHATASLRSANSKAIYLNVGDALDPYDDRLKEFESKFDGYAEIPSVNEGLRELLIRLLEVLAQ